MARTGWLTLLVCALMALFSTSAHATQYPDQGSAYSACTTAAATFSARYPGGFVTDNCPFNQEWREYTCRGQVGAQIFGCGEGYNHSFSFPFEMYCDARKDYNGSFPGGQFKPRSGSLSCDMGCETYWFDNADGSVNGRTSGKTCTGEKYDSDEECNAASPGSYYNRQIGVCEPQKPECPTGQANSLGKCEPEPCPSGMVQQADGTCKKKDNECPAGQVRSPDGSCLPGDGQCAAGEVRGADGTCKRDSDDDGKPDEPGDKDTFSGGDDCNSPPSCSGSPILCGQARIQWRIECNTRKNRNIAGGSCASMPICTGDKCDALEYSQLLMQWRTACATEKLASQGSGSGSGDGGQPDWTKVSGMNTDLASGSSPDDTKVLTVKTLSMNDLDQSGIGGGGSCMGFAAGGGQGIASGFTDTFASPPAFFCNYIGQIKALIILLAACGAAVILARGGA